MKPRGRGPRYLASVASSVATVVAGIGAAAIGTVALGACAGCGATAHETNLKPIAASSFDGVDIDQGAHLLYMSDRVNKGLDVVDVSRSTPRFLQTVTLGALPNGLAIASDRHRVYVGMDGGSVAVVDTDPGSPSFMKVIGRIAVDKTTADLVDYSPVRNRLYVSTSAGGEVVGVDTLTNRVSERYFLNMPLEQPRYNPADGMLYVTSPSDDSLVQVDPSNNKVLNRYQVPGCRATGLAINPARQLALVACSGSIALFKLPSGERTITRAVEGGDLVNYNAAADRFVLASPHGSKDSAVGVFAGDGTFLGSVPATPKAHAAAFDSSQGLVYAPGVAGILSFAPAACAPTPDWVKVGLGLSVYGLPLMLIGLVLLFYARARDREREIEATTGRSRWRVRQEYLAAERERMRALEDAILDPPDHHRFST